MIQHISIKNFAIIDFIEFDLESGFTVVTGETGAGKSIILDALKFLMGQRADSKMVGNFSTKSILEATFNISKYNLKSFFNANDLDYDANNTIIRREINAQGKSRAFINDSPVKLEVLKKLTSSLIDIHSQHQTLLLNNTSFQTTLIDSIAISSTNDHVELLEQYTNNFKEYHNLKNCLAEIRHADNEYGKQIDYYNFLVDELNTASLKEGEKEEIEKKLRIAEAKEVLVNTLSELYNTIEIGSQSDSLNDIMNRQLNKLSKVQDYAEPYKTLYDRLTSVSIELNDIANEVSSQLSSIEEQFIDTTQLRDRLNLINELESKHRVNNYEALLSKHRELIHQVEQFSNTEKSIQGLELKILALEKELVNLANKLNKNRVEVAPIVESQILTSLSNLGMPNAKFKVSIEQQDKLNSTGNSTLKFLFSANKGVNLQELAKVASGGENSRLMLSLKAVLAKHQNLPCLILDEIDTGISGEIASKMANMLSAISENIQLIAISHLPQIASKAKNHLKVSKNETKDTTLTTIAKLAPKERLYELSKMLSGEVISEAALENAKALLQKGS